MPVLASARCIDVPPFCTSVACTLLLKVVRAAYRLFISATSGAFTCSAAREWRPRWRLNSSPSRPLGESAYLLDAAISLQ